MKGGRGYSKLYTMAVDLGLSVSTLSLTEERMSQNCGSGSAGYWLLKGSSSSQQWWSTHLIPTLWRQRQASLVYIVTLRITWAT